MPIHRPPSAAAKPAAVALRVPASGACCERARKLAGKSLDPSDAPKLPLRDCGRIDCQCRYETVSNRRRRARREDGGERREEIRFETKDGRRKSNDRRKRNAVWDGR